MRPTLPVLLLALGLAACTTAERAADTAGEGVEDAAGATETVARGAADTAEDAAGMAADLATDAYDEARGLFGADRVPDNARTAVAQISSPADTSTGVRGTVTFVELADGVRVRYDVTGLASGSTHGLHVHADGSCAPGDADGDGAMEAAGAAGGHLNPGDDGHGGPDDDMDDKHAGDLGNITVSGGRAQGALEVESLSFSGARSVLNRAVIVHSRRDDLETDPGGDSGARIGCGVTTQASRRM